MPITPQDFNNAISQAATDFVKHLGETLLGWKGVQVNVIFDPNRTDLIIIKGGPTVQAWISIGPSDKDFKRVLYDVAKSAARAWNPVEIENNHKIIHKRGDKIKSRKGEPGFLIPMKYCKVTMYKSVTLKGPDGVSVTVEDNSGRRLESEMIYEARSKISSLIEWDNREDSE